MGVDVPVAGSNAGGLIPSSALLYCSSLDVAVSCLGCSGSESELSGALILQLLDSLSLAVVGLCCRRQKCAFYKSDDVFNLFVIFFKK